MERRLFRENIDLLAADIQLCVMKTPLDFLLLPLLRVRGRGGSLACRASGHFLPCLESTACLGSPPLRSKWLASRSQQPPPHPPTPPGGGLQGGGQRGDPRGRFLCTPADGPTAPCWAARRRRLSHHFLAPLVPPTTVPPRGLCSKAAIGAGVGGVETGRSLPCGLGGLEF